MAFFTCEKSYLHCQLSIVNCQFVFILDFQFSILNFYERSFHAEDQCITLFGGEPHRGR